MGCYPDLSNHLLGTSTRMKLNMKAGLGVVVALLCSSLVLHLAKLDYNMFRDTFVLWKAAVTVGTPMLFALLWFWIFHLASKAPGKR